MLNRNCTREDDPLGDDYIEALLRSRDADKMGEGAKRLIRTHGDHVRSRIRFAGPDLEDAFIEAAMNVVKSIHTFDKSKRPLRIWFVAIAINCARRWQRNATKRDSASKEYAKNVTVRGSRADPVSDSIDHEMQARLAQFIHFAIGSFTPIERSVMEAFLKGELDYEALAIKHQVTKHALYCTLDRAKKKLGRESTDNLLWEWLKNRSRG